MKLVLIFFILVNYLNAMNCSDYKDFQLFNGHYYSISIDKLTFESAKQIAENNGGTLAIPNSQAENDFIKNLIDGGSIGWIGIYDPNKLQNYCYGTNCAYDSSRFKDVKNNSLLYKNFASNQPDNLVKEYDVVEGKQKVSPLGEHWVAMNGNNGKWFDDGNHADQYNNPVKYKAVFEFESLNECTPPTDDGVQELTGRFCNTKIWDSTIDALTMGQTLDCQTDTNGNEYCPSALAECAEQWDYDNGFSVAGVGQVVDYANKIETQLSQPASMVTTIANPVILDITYANNDTYNINLGYQILSVKGLTDCGDYFGICGGTTNSTKRFYKNGNVVINREYQYGTYEITRKCDSEKQEISIVNSTITVTVPKAGNAYYNATLNGTITGVDGYSDCGDYYGLCGTSSRHVKFYKNGNIYVNEEYKYGTYYVHLQTNTTIYKCFYYTCPTNQDYLIDFTTGVCNATTSTCPNNYIPTTGAETLKGECKKTREYTYYNYLCNNSQNTQGYNYTPTNSGGNTGKTDPNNTTINDTLDDVLNSSIPPTNNCKREKFTCQANADRPCSYVDNKWQCSPFPCLGQSNLENLDTQVGKDDKNNDGWSEDGACTGTIYIFNGKSNKCRTSDMFFGLVGGGCCDKEKVFAGLVACKENEKVLAKKREQKQAHFIGNFCSKKLRLGLVSICVQKSDSYCTFNSSLGKIIQEQGREQLGISWGSSENPQCRGFTPEEFQKIDFSKIDLTEFVKDIQSSVQTSVIQNLGTYVKDKVGDFYGN
jgi:conjugal transfer mating pair stabilization protein TraN